ncbi:hypothetical protein TWF106_006457 [Orbilia oligospora]|uniref:Protein kinase domain-containing protein n=1 Tax=Orbilia oligospora TaxID=2813651 RepID=A0A7C8ULA2_ORBOL|nr:hypothetical protein TWF106_006457 [Orbilia oligospora]
MLTNKPLYPIHNDVEPSDVVYLFPSKGKDSTIGTLHHPRNHEFVRSRQSTFGPDSSEVVDDFILLSLKTPPKNDKLGWVFGSGDGADVFLTCAEKDNHFVGEFHFAIKFNRSSGILMVQNHARNGTYISQGRDLDTNVNFRELHDEAISQAEALSQFTQISIPGITFLVTVPTRSLEQDLEYQIQLGIFLENSFTGYPTPVTPTEFDSTVSGYSIRNPIEQINPGQKSTGDTFLAIELVSGNKYTAKYYTRDPTTTRADWEVERDMLSTLKHKNVIHLTKLIEKGTELYLLTPASPQGDISQHNYTAWRREQKSAAIYQIVDIIQYLHNSNIAHLDIQPRSFLVFCQDPPFLRIRNFSKATSEDTVCMIGVHNSFTAPEMQPTAKSTKPSYEPKRADMWSIGVMILSFWEQMIQDKALVDGSRTGENSILPVCATVVFKPNHPLVILIQKLLVVKPKERLTATECYVEYSSGALKDSDNPLSDHQVGQRAPFAIEKHEHDSDLPSTRASMQPSTPEFVNDAASSVHAEVGSNDHSEPTTDSTPTPIGSRLSPLLPSSFEISAYESSFNTGAGHLQLEYSPTTHDVGARVVPREAEISAADSADPDDGLADTYEIPNSSPPPVLGLSGGAVDFGLVPGTKETEASPSIADSHEEWATTVERLDSSPSPPHSRLNPKSVTGGNESRQRSPLPLQASTDQLHGFGKKPAVGNRISQSCAKFGALPGSSERPSLPSAPRGTATESSDRPKTGNYPIKDYTQRAGASPSRQSNTRGTDDDRQSERDSLGSWCSTVASLTESESRIYTGSPGTDNKQPGDVPKIEEERDSISSPHLKPGSMPSPVEQSVPTASPLQPPSAPTADSEEEFIDELASICPPPIKRDRKSSRRRVVPPASPDFEDELVAVSAD